MPTSPDTLLRRVKQAGAQSPGIPKFVGIDDWAWCKGQRYGTIVVDLETSDVIDLLPDRDATTVRSWLEAHPGIELVSRDRSSSYSQAASEAASQGPAGRRRSMAPVEERARGHRTFVRASSARHHGGAQARRSRSQTMANVSLLDQPEPAGTSSNFRTTRIVTGCPSSSTPGNVLLEPRPFHRPASPPKMPS